MKTADATIHVKLDDGKQPDVVNTQTMADDDYQTTYRTVNIDSRYIPDAVNMHAIIEKDVTRPDVVKTMIVGDNQTAYGTINVELRDRPDVVNMHTTISHGVTIPYVVKKMEV